MGLQTLLLTVAVLATGAVLVRAMVRQPADPTRFARRAAVVSLTLLALLLAVPFWIDRPEAHDRAGCGSALAPDRTDRFGLPREPVTECRQAYTLRFAEAAALGVLTAAGVTLPLWRGTRTRRVPAM
jgi:hypothetical protein